MPAPHPPLPPSDPRDHLPGGPGGGTDSTGSDPRESPTDSTGSDPVESVAVPWEALEDLAAGALPVGEARALERRLAAEPGLAAAYGRVLHVQRALDAERLLPFPASLAARIL